MPESANESVPLGLHEGPDNDYTVHCIAERVGTNEALVIYSKTKGDKAGQYLAESVGIFLSLLKSGHCKYRGPVARLERKHGRTGRLFDKKF